MKYWLVKVHFGLVGGTWEMHETPQLKCDDKIMDLGPECFSSLRHEENYLCSLVKIILPLYHLILRCDITLFAFRIYCLSGLDKCYFVFGWWGHVYWFIGNKETSR